MDRSGDSDAASGAPAPAPAPARRGVGRRLLPWTTAVAAALTLGTLAVLPGSSGPLLEDAASASARQTDDRTAAPGRGTPPGQGRPDKTPPAATTTPPPGTASPLPSTPAVPGGTAPGETVTVFAETDAYLANPGQGYQGWSHSTGALAQSTEYRRGEHPEQGGFDWASLNPGEGVFDWTPVDRFLAECAARGEQGSFRVYTMSGAPYGTHRVPQWVVDRGAVIRATAQGEPDYRNRTYQQHWGAFVDALAARYDGDPRIAFIDISGYGLFNEWQANDLTDLADPAGSGDSVDASTRRHLVQMYVGGTGTARVVEADGVGEGTLDYGHPGFQRTQLVMPYGGIWGTSRWVASTYPHVGFRNDALFTADAELADFQAMGYGVTDVWRTAPVVFEAVGPPPPGAETVAAETLRGMGASFLHENAVVDDEDVLTELSTPLGYRYFPSRIAAGTTAAAGGTLSIAGTWSNTGSARAYPRMGQDFTLTYALADGDGAVVASWRADHAVSEWLPGEQHDVRDAVTLPDLAAGDHTLLVGVVERSTGDRIRLPLDTAAGNGWYRVSRVSVTA
ncbi:DUF4832 domain-containing protein [Geodermatophilus nigrescens]